MYTKITEKQVESYDKYGMHNAIKVGAILAALPGNFVTPNVTAGATGATVTENVFVCPTKLNITKATFVIGVVQTGADNTPTVSLYNLTKAETIGVTAAIALAGTIGDKKTLVLTAANVDCNEDDVLQMKIINPTATITVALQGKVQFDWELSV